jgi:hypothetical protein
MKKALWLVSLAVAGYFTSVPFVVAATQGTDIYAKIANEIGRETKISKKGATRTLLTANALTVDSIGASVLNAIKKVPIPSAIATPPRTTTSSTGTFTRADIAEDIRNALTKALGAPPFSTGEKYPYFPVYQQIANQSYSTGFSTGRAIQNIQNTFVTGGSGTGSLTSVDISGGTTGLTFAGGPITSSGTFSMSGTLGISNGGTGIVAAPSYGQLLVGNSSGGYDLLATSSLGILASSFSGTTDTITEGTVNKFYSDSLTNIYLHASTTLPKTYTSNTFSNSNIFSGALTIQNLNGPLQANNGVVSATSSVGVLYGGTGLTTAPSFGGILVGNNSGGYTLTATSSLGLNVSALSGTLTVTQGGTGAATFGQGWIFSSGGTGALSASTSPTVSYLVATSTRASIFPYASTTAVSASGIIYSGNFLATASSTFANFTGGNATTTNATSTSLFATTGTATTFNATTFTAGTILATGSTTLQNFTGGNATTTNATSTSLFASILNTSNLTASVMLATGSTTLQNFTGRAATTTNATSTTHFATTGAVTTFTAGTILSTGSTTLQNFTGLNATTTNATSSSLFATTGAVTTFIANTILATGSTTLQNFTGLNATTTNATSTSFFTSNFTLGSLTGPLSAANGVISASSTISVAYGGTGLSTIPSFGNILVGSNTGGYTLTATSSLGLLGSTTISALTANFIPKWNTTAFANSIIFDSGTRIGIASSTPAATFSVSGTAWMDVSNLTLASTSAVGGLIINHLASTTNLLSALRQNAWSLSTSTLLDQGDSIFNVNLSTTGATSTVGFFVSTSTGLTAGTGNPIPSALKNYVIVGNGKTQAGMAIVKGGLCVDSDGWCTASTTGVISASNGVQTANSDLAEMYYSNETLEPGDLVTTGDPATYVIKATSNGLGAIGVVSTKPGLVLGLGPDQESAIPSFPIALAGRVPVKVSLDNGVIATGDYLTISKIPGVAVKATKDSQVIGQALEPYSGTGPGKVMAIVRSTYYKSEFNPDIDELRASLSASETKIVSIEDNLKGLLQASSTALRSDLTLTGTTTLSGGLVLSGGATIAGGLTVDSIGSSGATLQILSDITFFGRPYFTSDTLGSALIKAGARTVAITFDRDYTDVPEVQASLALNEAAANTAIEDAIFSQDVRFIVTGRSVHGFTIKLNKAAPADITFSWLALAAKNSKLFTSAAIEAAPPVPAPVVNPAPVLPVSETIQETAAVSSTTEPVIEPATTTPAVEPEVVTEPAVAPVVAPITEPVTPPTPAEPAPAPAPEEAPAPATE